MSKNTMASATQDDTDDRAEQHLLSVRDLRRQRLINLIEQIAQGSAAVFAKKTGLSQSQVSQFVSSTYREGATLGERAARSIEAKAGVPFGWLDGDAGILASALTPADAGDPVSALARDMRELAAQREAADAAARASTLKSIQAGTRAVPAQAGTSNNVAVEALQNVAAQLRRGGAVVPLPWSTDSPSIESTLVRGLSLGLLLVETEIETIRLAGMAKGSPQIVVTERDSHPCVLVNWNSHIKIARQANRMTQERLAELVDVSTAVIERFENGEARSIDGPMLLTLCAVLRIDPAWLLGADDA